MTLLLAGSHSASLSQSGKPWGWGSIYYGQVGNGVSGSQYNAPVTLTPNVFNIVQVATGNYHTLFLKADGKVLACGYNHSGQVGNGTTIHQSTPVPVVGLTGVTQVAGGQEQSYALKSDGTVWAWGGNAYGELGNGTTTDSLTPVQVQGLTGIVQIAGGTYSGLAVKSDGTVWIWGGSTAVSVSSKIPGLSGVVQASRGWNHYLFLKSDGTVWAMGNGNYGQLGGGSNTDASAPQQVFGLSGVLQVVAKQDDSLAVTSDGTLWRWGANYYGQIGDGTTSDRNTPVAVLTGAVQGSIGNALTMAVKEDGTVWGWGYNSDGELGVGTTIGTLSPVQTLNLTNQTFIGAGVAHVLSVQATLQNTSIGAGSLTLAYASGVGARLNTKTYGSRIVYKPLDFTVDGISIGSARTLATGTATAYLTPAFGVGTHSVVASFAGDRLYKPSSKTFTITITKADTSIVTAKAALYRGVTANLKATLTRKTDNGHPANVEVLFKIDGTVIGSAITDGTGTAALSYAADTTFSIGSHNLTAEFVGDANHNGSASSAVALTISKSKTTLTQPNVSRAAGSKVTLSATLKQSVGKIPQSGKTITFSVDGMVVGTGVTNGSGLATYVYLVPSTATLGVHPLAVSFDEDDYNLASVYSAATLTVK